MLNEDQLTLFAEFSYKRIRDINNEYLELIGNKIKEIGEMSKTDLIRLKQMRDYTRELDSIESKLVNASGKTVDEINLIIEKVAKENYNFSAPFFAAAGMEATSFNDDKPLRRYIKSIARQTAQQHVNLAQHTAFMVFDESGEVVSSYFPANKHKAPTSLSDTYTKVIDDAVAKAQLGYTDYQSSMRETIKAMADSGIRTVDYATGYSRRLDTAVRQNVLWGIKQCNQGVADIVGEEFGADGYEIDFHSGSRPSHSEMGGKQYAKGKARTVNGVYYPSFSSVEGLLQDFGCLHFKFSILLGISEPSHSDEELRGLKQKDAKRIEFEGKEYTKYELSQMQRKTETAIRHAKDRQIIAKASGDDTLRRQEQERINLLTRKYAKLCKESGLPTKAERMSVSGFRKVKTEQELAKNHLKNSAGHDILKENSKSNKISQNNKNNQTPSSIPKKKSKDGTSTFSKEAKEKLFRDERIISGNKYETAIVYNKNGDRLFTVKGDKNSVNFTEGQLKKMNGCVVTHNHPEKNGLSQNDIYVACQSNFAEIRACRADGSYVMHPKGVKVSELGSFSDFSKDYNALYDDIAFKYRDIAAQNGKHIGAYFDDMEKEFAKQLSEKYNFEYFWEESKWK